MPLTDAQRAEFEALAKPLMQWLCENKHPHTSVIIDGTSAELVESTVAFVTDEFVKD